MEIPERAQHPRDQCGKKMCIGRADPKATESRLGLLQGGALLSSSALWLQLYLQLFAQSHSSLASQKHPAQRRGPEHQFWARVRYGTHPKADLFLVLWLMG